MPDRITKCGTCMYFDEREAAASKHDGLCRFNPPVTQPDPKTQGLWPVVTEADWCGHFAEGAAAH